MSAGVPRFAHAIGSHKRPLPPSLLHCIVPQLRHFNSH